MNLNMIYLSDQTLVTQDIGRLAQQSFSLITWWTLLFRFWFNFTVENVHEDQRIIFNIVNLSKSKNLFRCGLTPLVRSTSRPKWWNNRISLIWNINPIYFVGRGSLKPMCIITNHQSTMTIMFYLLHLHLTKMEKSINLH